MITEIIDQYPIELYLVISPSVSLERSSAIQRRRFGVRKSPIHQTRARGITAIFHPIIFVPDDRRPDASPYQNSSESGTQNCRKPFDRPVRFRKCVHPHSIKTVRKKKLYTKVPYRTYARRLSDSLRHRLVWLSYSPSTSAIQPPVTIAVCCYVIACKPVFAELPAASAITPSNWILHNGILLRTIASRPASLRPGRGRRFGRNNANSCVHSSW